MCEKQWPARWAILASLIPTAFAGAAIADQIVADADTARPGINSRVQVGGGADGCYRITPRPGQPGALIFILPNGTDASKFTGVAANVRALNPPGAGGPAVKARLLAFDGNNRMVLQRRLDLDPAAEDNEVSMPWVKWRWGDPTYGARSDIRKIGIRIESAAPGQEVELDNLRLITPAEGVDPSAAGKEWLRRLAFEDRDVRMAEADGLLVATDATEGLTDADLLRILGRMRQARALAHRLFGDAVRPINGPHPPALLIFKEQDDYAAFFRRIGQEWNAQIPPPTTDGVTFEDIATSTFDPKQGADRPSYTHEGMHAVVGHDVRVVVGRNNTSWLQEGLATYVQLCVHPASISRNPFPAEFARPIAADGSTFFKPLSQLLASRVSTRNYAQLATVVAFLIEAKPEWLPVIARELAAGHDAEKALAACGSSVAELEKEWLAWGRMKFSKPDPQGGARAAGARAAAARPLFDVPQELRGEPAEAAAGEGK